jgi:putative endonuclease
MTGCFVYPVTNVPRGTLYTGVTNDLIRRLHEHREGQTKGFSQRYDLKMLVYYERHNTPRSAIRREKNTKHWSRQRKLELVESFNPRWRDLWKDITR